jgi:hypothetical protein
MTLFNYLNTPTYADADYMAGCLSITTTELFRRLDLEPIVEEAYFLEEIKTKNLPSFLSRAADATEQQRIMKDVGFTGVALRIDETKYVDPYEWQGFKRIMGCSAGNWVYLRKGVSYLSLAYTLTCHKITVTPTFLPSVHGVEENGKVNLVWPIAPVRRGRSDAFDVLYKAEDRYRLLSMAKKYRQL